MSRPLLHCAFPIALLLSAAPALAAQTYHWIGTGDESWTTASHWSPSRTAPMPDDILVFDRGDSMPVFQVPSQSVGQIVVSGNGSIVSLQSVAGSAITLTGGPGEDLSVAGGTKLYLLGASAITLSLATGASGNLAGTVAVGGGAHRLLAADTDGLIVAAGGSVVTQAGFSGNVFGTTSLNSVRFQDGSLYVSAAGANPFGAAQPNSVVRFDHGSRFRVDAGTPAAAGRTYADFECNVSGSLTMSSSAAPLVMDSLLVTRGALTIAVGDGRFQGAIRVAPGATLDFAPGSAATYTLGGTSPQWIRALGGNFNANANVQLVIDNPAHVFVDSTGSTTAATLSFVQGCLVMPMISAEEIGRFQCAAESSGGPATGWVVGALGLPVTTNQTLTYPVGEIGNCMPTTVRIESTIFRTTHMFVSTLPILATDSARAQLEAGKTIHRLWRLDQPDNAEATTFGIDLTFLPGEVDPGTDLSQAVVREWISDHAILNAWRRSQIDARTATSFLVTGAFTSERSMFAAGDSALIYVDGGRVTQAEGAGPMPAFVTLSQPSLDTVYVDYATADSTALAGADYEATSGSFAIQPGFAYVPITPLPMVNIVNDTVFEPDESFRLELSGVIHAIPRYRGLYTILNDDPSAPPTIDLLYPDGGEHLVIGTEPAITWSASDDGGVTGVDIELSRDGGATYAPLAQNLPDAGAWNWTVTGPVTSAARIRVTAHDSDGHTASDASAADFAVDDVAGVTPLPVAFALGRVVPNPARGAARFAIDLPRACRVVLTVVDVRGRTVARLLNGPLEAGRHPVEWDAGSAPAGLYFVRMEAEGFSAHGRFALVR